jgi:hypothetical protein
MMWAGCASKGEVPGEGLQAAACSLRAGWFGWCCWGVRDLSPSLDEGLGPLHSPTASERTSPQPQPPGPDCSVTSGGGPGARKREPRYHDARRNSEPARLRPIRRRTATRCPGLQRLRRLCTDGPWPLCVHVRRFRTRWTARNSPPRFFRGCAHRASPRTRYGMILDGERKRLKMERYRASHAMQTEREKYSHRNSGGMD